MIAGSWKVIGRGCVPDGAPTVLYTCTGCGKEARLPVLGLPVAQVQAGIVFDNGIFALPDTIQCRRCRRRYTSREAKTGGTS